MTSRRLHILFAAALASASPLALAPPAAAQAAPAEAPLLEVKADPLTGKIIATLPRPGADGTSGRYIYVSQLETGVGSAAAVLDRSAPGGSRILVFRRLGKKVAAEIENNKFVALSGTPAEQAAVRGSFAGSTIWMGEVASTNKDGSFTVDLASFLARDDLGIVQRLKEGGAGDFKLVGDLSAADPNFVKSFPKNVELAARLTFRSDDPGAEIANIIPDSTLSITLRHSLIALPEPGYVPRTDPIGFSLGRQQLDYLKPLGAGIVTDLARRFRLDKTDPAAARSPVRKPITFYIDPGAPEPVRTALREGVSWWAQAFDAAGFIDAFKVDILPAGADPLDVRYNVVNWVNRATRGWSYGAAIDDPRTGEIIKGSVMLGSLRARQDMLIFQALVGARLTGTGDPDDPLTATVARLRQLGAHEVGHSIGLSHNMGASSQGRGSVMDYPGPRVILVNGVPSLRDAYGTGLGAYDKWAIDWLYGARTDAEARPKLAEARARNIRFVADGNDSRSVGSAQPNGAIWDDGSDSIAELRRVMQVRAVAVSRFGENALPAGEALSGLRRAFVPIWLLHRYQVEAASKQLGGVDFPYALAGEGLRAAPVPGATQRAALDALLETLRPEALTVPQPLQLAMSSGYGGSEDRQTEIEIIPTSGGTVFDPLKATEVAAVQTLNALLNPDRLNRLESQHGADPSVPSPSDVAERLIEQSFAATDRDVGRRIATTAVLSLARAQRSATLSPAIALAMSAQLDRLAERLRRQRGDDVRADWSRGLAAMLSDRQALDKAIADPARLPRVPPGMPIGMEEG
ncbi:zinc-dependent metalloprotease [Sphingomonas humi]|uniref:Zinc-dependent metalloprotease n=1 Tax=Sphingomonas humi TaxID=335630 RepID=A0ABP7RHU8_9SPHN